MKKMIFLAFLILSFNSYSEDVDPSVFCNQTYECTDRMREISDNYQVGNTNFTKESLVGASGGCYHISSLYDGNKEHHAAFLFERAGADLMTAGVFSFFAGTDPYQNMSSSQLKDWFIQRDSRFSKSVETSNQVELQFIGDLSDYHYWFRSDKENRKVFMIGRQLSEDYSGYIFCELNRR